MEKAFSSASIEDIRRHRDACVANRTGFPRVSPECFSFPKRSQLAEYMILALEVVDNFTWRFDLDDIFMISNVLGMGEELGITSIAELFYYRGNYAIQMDEIEYYTLVTPETITRFIRETSGEIYLGHCLFGRYSAE